MLNANKHTVYTVCTSGIDWKRKRAVQDAILSVIHKIIFLFISFSGFFFHYLRPVRHYYLWAITETIIKYNGFLWWFFPNSYQYISLHAKSRTFFWKCLVRGPQIYLAYYSFPCDIINLIPVTDKLSNQLYRMFIN